MSTIQRLEPILEVTTQEESKSIVPGFEEQEKDSKWIRTFRCGCGLCRFIPTAQRAECPMESASTAVWLWGMNTDYIGRLDYVDNYVSSGGPDEEEVEVMIAEVTG